MSLHLRPPRPDDASRCGEICFHAFKEIAEQHRFPPDFPSPDVAAGLLAALFAREDIYAVVAEMDGRPVGSNFLWKSAQIAGVGPITVDPDTQDTGVGRRLMDDVLHTAAQEGFAGVRLVQAAYHGRSMSLYTKLGFEVREPLVTLQGPPMGLHIRGHDVRRAAMKDMDACNAMCMRIHGHDRGGDLADAIHQGTATLVERDGRVTGYATVVGFFGHAVGETSEDLKALIGAAEGFAGPGLLLPTRNTSLFRWCLESGLRVVQPMTLMSKGLYNEPAGPFLPSIIY